jgi:hypothetical protein
MLIINLVPIYYDCPLCYYPFMISYPLIVAMIIHMFPILFVIMVVIYVYVYVYIYIYICSLLSLLLSTIIIIILDYHDHLLYYHAIFLHSFLFQC